MQQLLEYLVKELTGSDEIKVEHSEEDSVNVYTISAPQSVMGLLIGREGKIIRAVRSLARARAIVDQVGIAIKLQEA
jgi:predicted RNA-binding protein YlqC (UPF0109 family)